ncbi:hypothetical protein GCM10022393_42200 [Aquimarina addita]|uniref:Uncharacterized protein n=1 Tax=Aquimarina addita TaxID=870485 RepID=A0ABP6UUU4_9FLAO
MNTLAFSENRVDRIFHNTHTANQYYDHLIELGYTPDHITVLMSKDTKDKFYASNPHVEKNSDEALKGAGAGSAIGGTIGAVVGAVAAIGTSVIIPGLGLAIAGPLVAAFAGAGIGGAGGALVGALTKAGLSDTASTEYVKSIEEGKIIISVEPINEDHYTTLSAYDDVIYSKSSTTI